ncbi:MAG: ATP-binding protein [Candidatus Pacebacteria bacterium]|nr:ATP-binding protein [Candidatus Paceibacterota bacterium]
MQKRHIWKKLLPEISTKEILVITGPRQVGKTTTLLWLLEQIKDTNKIYLDLENLADRELFEIKDYNTVISELESRGLTTDRKMYIALDEIQLLPNLPSIVKYLYDHYNIKFFLSGSSSYYIKNRFTESMAGRKIVYEMFPLSFQEFLDFKDVEYKIDTNIFEKNSFSEPAYQKLYIHYQEFVEFGGLPQVVLTSSVGRKQQLLEEIFSSYINIDVNSMADFKSTKDLRNVIKLLATRIGNKLNISEIGNIAGLSRITVENYIEFLEQTYLISTVSVFSTSEDVKTRLQKKLYFVDTGIANINADLSSGSKFENTIRHQLQFLGKIQYFSDRNGEIDFILDDGSKKIALEVKETPTKTDYTTLTKRAAKLRIPTISVIGRQPSANFTNFLWGGSIR